jgi:hypothetical protein
MEYRKNAWKTPELISTWNVRRIRLKPAHGGVPHGESKQTVAKRKTICRACGQAMLKGEPRITFMWDFKGCGSWTPQEVHLHAHDCTNALTPGEQQRIYSKPDTLSLPEPRNLLARLAPLQGKHLPHSFGEAAQLLERPYYKLSLDTCAAIERLAGDSDVLLFDDEVQVTWGDADGGKALMPLRHPL